MKLREKLEERLEYLKRGLCSCKHELQKYDELEESEKLAIEMMHDSTNIDFMGGSIVEEVKQRQYYKKYKVTADTLLEKYSYDDCVEMARVMKGEAI
jgi:hypothetical protein